jgi:hypothetical protein
MLHERRKFKRLDIFHVIEIKSYTTLSGLIRNFSYEGFSFEMDSIDFLQKEKIEFKLQHHQSNLSVSFLGDFVWEKRVANKFLAGIKLRKIDKEIKDKWIEILCTIRNIPIDFFYYGKNSEILMSDRKEEKTITNERIKLISETASNNKKILITNVIIGLSIAFLLVLGVFTFKGLRIPDSNASHQAIQKNFDQKEHFSKPENILRLHVKEQAGNRVLDEDVTLKKDRETQNIYSKSIVQVKSDHSIERKNKLKELLKADDQHASQLIYTIQIESLPKISDAQKQFNFMLRSINEKNLNLLRIEKVGKYYTIRLGKFENYDTAKKFLQEVKPSLSEAVILKAHIINERLIRLNEYF